MRQSRVYVGQWVRSGKMDDSFFYYGKVIQITGYDIVLQLIPLNRDTIGTYSARPKDIRPFFPSQEEIATYLSALVTE